mgnify:CR=1 FL=1
MDSDLIFPTHQSSYQPPMQNVTYDKEIGEIVSLLQDENPLLSSPGPSRQSFDHGFENLNIKQDYSMMDTTESYEIQPQQQIDRGQFASTSANSSMDYHQLLPQETPNIQINPYSLYDQPSQLNQQQYPPTQYMYEMPRASSSSAIHGMSGELQQVVVDENTLIRPLVTFNSIS